MSDDEELDQFGDDDDDDDVLFPRVSLFDTPMFEVPVSSKSAARAARLSSQESTNLRSKLVDAAQAAAPRKFSLATPTAMGQGVNRRDSVLVQSSQASRRVSVAPRSPSFDLNLNSEKIADSIKTFSTFQDFKRNGSPSPNRFGQERPTISRARSGSNQLTTEMNPRLNRRESVVDGKSLSASTTPADSSPKLRVVSTVLRATVRARGGLAQVKSISTASKLEKIPLANRKVLFQTRWSRSAMNVGDDDDGFHFEPQDLQATRRKTNDDVVPRNNINLFDCRRDRRQSPEITKTVIQGGPAFRALGSLPGFAGCGNQFINCLVNNSDIFTLKLEEIRDLSIGRRKSGGTPFSVIVVVQGSCQVEIGHDAVGHCGPGQSYGLASVLGHVASVKTNRTVIPDTATDVYVRGKSTDGCQCVLFRVPALKESLQQFPQECAELRDRLRSISRGCDGTHPFLVALQSSEIARPAVRKSCTRHWFAAGENICLAGKTEPGGLLLIRKGTVAVHIGGIEVRQITQGELIGEDVLFEVNKKWAFKVRCVTDVDVQVLRRRLFVESLDKMKQGTGDEVREASRLLVLLTGHWKDERVILSWPILRGYDQEFLIRLAESMETRVFMPNCKVMDTGGVQPDGTNSGDNSLRRAALYFVLHGTCEEIVFAERLARGQQIVSNEVRRGARVILPGSYVGVADLFGIYEEKCSVVTSRTLALVAVLYRGVFLEQADLFGKRLQAPEVTRLLNEEADRTSIGNAEIRTDNVQKTFSSLPLFRLCDKRLVDKICIVVDHNFYITDQRLCRNDMVSSTMFVIARGDVRMKIEGIEIRKFGPGDGLNFLALTADNYTPVYDVVCQCTTELWSLSHVSFRATLDLMPTEKRRFAMLLGAPLSSLACVGESKASPIRTDNSRIMTPDHHRGLDVSKRTASGCELDKIEMFRECSLEFLTWIQGHLEATLYFTDDVILAEGAQDDAMYIVCQGLVIIEGSSTQQSQVTLSRGSILGEQRLTEVQQTVQCTATAVEPTLIQILHGNVLKNGLKLFPHDAEIIEEVMFKWLNNPQSRDLSKIPIFTNISKKICIELGRYSRTRLVRQGELIFNHDSVEEKLCVLVSGTVAPDTTDTSLILTMKKYGNAAVILGIAANNLQQVRAESVCIVSEVDCRIFLQMIQNSTKEIIALVTYITGYLFPRDCDHVPFFKGLGNAFINILIDESAWVMYLPDQEVVRQGRTGKTMYILCHGRSTKRADGVAVGLPLVPGDCVGEGIFLGITDKYKYTLRAMTVCHCRSIGADALEKGLDKFPTEFERVEVLRMTAQVSITSMEKTLGGQVAKQRLRRRVNGAFLKHVTSMRDSRASDTDDEAIHKNCPEKEFGDPTYRRVSNKLFTIEAEADDIRRETLAKPYGEARRRESPKEDRRTMFSANQDSISSIRGTLSVRQMGGLDSVPARSTKFCVHASPDEESDFDPNDDFFAKMQDFHKQAMNDPVSELMLKTSEKNEKLLRGKVLRLLKAGLPLDHCRGGKRQVSQDDIETLDRILPSLPATSSKSNGLNDLAKSKLEQRFKQLNKPTSRLAATL